jgi:hypothetical protein
MPPFKPPGLKIAIHSDDLLTTGGGAGSLEDNEVTVACVLPCTSLYCLMKQWVTINKSLLAGIMGCEG